MSQDDRGERTRADSPSPTPSYPDLKSHRERILILIKTYPHPSDKYRETVCTIGLTVSGRLVRLYPIPYRYLPEDQQYKKYQWIDVLIEKVEKKHDNRLDSYRPDMATLKVVGKPIPTNLRGWEERQDLILKPFNVYTSVEHFLQSAKKTRSSIGLIKPAGIPRFVAEPASPQWSALHERVLSQMPLFGTQTKKLTKIPFDFKYVFKCSDPSCKKEHKIQISDWEVFELYRRLKNKYGYSEDVILKKMEEKWVNQMWGANRDSYLFLGTHHRFGTPIILGVFWPPERGHGTKSLF